MFANMDLSFRPGIILILKGLISISTGRALMFNADRYPVDSLQSYARGIGFTNLSTGFDLMLFHMLGDALFTVGTFKVYPGPVVLAIMTVLSIVLLVRSQRTPVRK